MRQVKKRKLFTAQVRYSVPYSLIKKKIKQRLALLRNIMKNEININELVRLTELYKDVQVCVEVRGSIRAVL